MTINFGVYTIGQLQEFKGLLDQAINESDFIDIPILKSKIERYIKKALPNTKSIKISSAQKSIICPECKKALLSPVYNQDGLLILGCKGCRFSKIVSKAEWKAAIE